MPDYQLFGGFLILEPDADIPTEVEVVAPEMPLFCAIGDDDTVPTAKIEKPTSIEVIKSELAVPLYTLAKLPKEMELEPWQCELIKDKEKAADDAVYAFGMLFDEMQTRAYAPNITSIRLRVEKQFAQPYPIRKPSATAIWGANAVVETIEGVLPTPGVKVTYPNSQVFYWIANNALYSLFVEFGFNPLEGEADVADINFVPDLEML